MRRRYNDWGEGEQKYDDGLRKDYRKMERRGRKAWKLGREAFVGCASEAWGSGGRRRDLGASLVWA